MPTPGAVQSGHYVWPAAPGICDYLVENFKSVKGNGRKLRVVELGAGCGLAGLAFAQLNPDSHVVFTDHDPGVLKTIESNVKAQTRPQATCSTQSLGWGPNGSHELKKISNTFGTTSDPLDEGRVDLIIGSDVIYALEVVDLLFYTVNELLLKSRADEESGLPEFLMCSSFSYDNATEAGIDEACQKYKLSREILVDELPGRSSEKSTTSKGVRIQRFRRL